MASVALFHHAQGLTDGIRAFAAGLKAGGHTVHTPDVYDGAVFGDLESGVANAERIGFLEIIERGRTSVSHLPSDLVVAGFSLGALVAHNLAQTRPGARGALLYHHGDVPVDMFGLEWPADVNLQLHIADHDPYYEPDTVASFQDAVQAVASAELFIYPLAAHLFTDPSLPDFAEIETTLVLERTLAFLES